MSLQSEQLAKRLRKLKQVSAPPRQEFVTQVERNLLRKAEKLELYRKRKRVLAKTAGIAATVALAFWLPLSKGDQLLHQAPSASQEQGKDQLKARQTERIETAPALTPESERVDKQTQPLQSVGIPTIAEADVAEAVSTVAAQTTSGKLADASSSAGKNGLESAAEKYLQEQLGSRSEQYQINRTFSDTRRGKIAFSRVINGIPFFESSVTVKMQNGKPTGLVLHDSTVIERNLALFPKSDGLLSAETVAEKVAASLRLIYLGGEEAGMQPSLRYQPAFAGFVDAKSGEWVQDDEKHGDSSELRQVFPVKAEGRKLFARSSAEAAMLLEKEFGFTIHSGNLVATAEDASHSTEFIWKLAEEKLIRATFSGKKGSLTGYMLEQPSTAAAGRSVLSEEQAVNVAINHLQPFLPSSIKQVSLEAVEINSSVMRLQFCEAIAGIPVIDRLYQVSIDAASGKVIGMSGDFAKPEVAVPEKKELISEEAARSQYIANHPFELVYIRPSANGEKTDAPRLVYRLSMQNGIPAGIDAHSGKLVGQ